MPNEALSIRLSYSEGFTMPDVGRALRGPAAGANSVSDFLTLEPVVTKNIETGMDYSADSFDASFTIYQTTSDYGSALTAVDIGGGSIRYDLQREPVEYVGLETTLAWYITELDTVDFAYAVNRGTKEDQATGKDSDLKGINATPDRFAVAWQRQWRDNLSSRLQYNHFLNRTFEDKNGDTAARFNGYQIVDLMLNHDLAKGHKLQYGIQNIFDEQYLSFYSQTERAGRANSQFAGLGRTHSISYTFEF